MENLKIPYRFFSKLNSGAQESNLVSLGYGPRMVFRSTRPRQVLSAGIEPAFTAPITLSGLEDRCGYESKNTDLTVCAFNSSLVVYQLATLSTELDISLLRQIFIHLTSLSDEKVLKFYRLYWKNMSQETSLTNTRHSF